MFWVVECVLMETERVSTNEIHDEEILFYVNLQKV